MTRILKPTQFLRRFCMALCAVSLHTGSVAWADTSFPNQPIRIVVPYAAGGTTDLIARLVGNEMSKVLGQSIVVENRAGANGNIGAEHVARAKPDGYTLQLGTAGNLTVNPALYKDMSFVPTEAFQPISMIATLPNLMVVNKDVPANTVQEFVAWAKEQSKDVFFASSGVGSTTHLTAELFNIATGLSMSHVAYKGSGPALIEIIGGTGPVVMFDNMPSAIGMVRQGSLKALAVSGPEREEGAPEIPTVKESGYPDFSVLTWFGLFAPAGTPPDVVERLNQAVVQVVEKPEVAQQLRQQGATPTTNTPEEYQRIVEEDTRRWAEVVGQAGIVMQ
ncbi:tripartite tricarboxylate transporter substrate binding protein [Alcaligenaceae bacterium]|nr:tripartite tricarboxylate transporter substrate binding protein [Alcaligenaceae bacterium]